jgi:VanZ family protein
MITPGVGISGHLLELFPSSLTNLSHLPAYGILTWLLAVGLRGREWPQPIAVFVAAQGALAFGIWMEILQGFVPGRVVDVGDIFLNAAGIGMVSFMIGTEMLPIAGGRGVVQVATASKRGCSAS